MCNCSETKKRDDSDLGIAHECEEKTLRLILDTPFNRQWYPNLIGRKFTSANCPSYAQWEFVDETSGQIFEVKDLRAMEVASKLIGRSAGRSSLFA